jgi:hypothetical protein
MLTQHTKEYKTLNIKLRRSRRLKSPSMQETGYYSRSTVSSGPETFTNNIGRELHR